MDSDPLEAALAAGDQSALAELFEKHRERLWRMVRFRLDPRLLGRVDPDDILQEAFMDALTRLPHFDGTMTGFLWLRWVVQQTMIAVHRRHLGAQMRSAHRERYLASPATSQSLMAVLSGTPTSPSEALMRNERAAALADALQAMSALDQEVIALRHFEDLANHEVAEALGITAKAASIRYVRALARLRGALQSLGEVSDAMLNVAFNGPPASPLAPPSSSAAGHESSSSSSPGSSAS